MPCMLDGREQFRFHTWPAIHSPSIGASVAVFLSVCLQPQASFYARVTRMDSKSEPGRPAARPSET